MHGRKMHLALSWTCTIWVKNPTLSLFIDLHQFSLVLLYMLRIMSEQLSILLYMSSVILFGVSFDAFNCGILPQISLCVLGLILNQCYQRQHTQSTRIQACRPKLPTSLSSTSSPRYTQSQTSPDGDQINKRPMLPL